MSVHLEVMRRWPAYRLEDVAALTPTEILRLLEATGPTGDPAFGSWAEYQRFRSELG